MKCIAIIQLQGEEENKWQEKGAEFLLNVLFDDSKSFITIRSLYDISIANVEAYLFFLKFLFQPERVDPRPSSDGSFKYDIRSDVWSLGIAMVEISTGCYPYRSGRTPFEQLSQVLDEPAPALPEGLFSHTYIDFINKA